MIKKITTFFFMLAILSVKAQNNGKLSNKARDFNRFPVTRIANIDFQYLAPYSYHTYLCDGTQLPPGKMERLYQSRVSTNIDFLSKNKWTFGTGLFYNYLHADTDTGGSVSRRIDMHYYFASLNVTRLSTLYDKMIVYSGSVIPSGGNNGLERVTGLISGSLVLRSDSNTKIMVGVVGIIDPSSILPAMVTLAYEKHLKNGWMVDIMIPQRIYMKKDIFNDGQISIGSELNTTNFYFKNPDENKKTYMFSQTEIMTGLSYEHIFFRKIISTIKSGLTYIPISRIVEINKSFNNYKYELKPDPTFYIRVGFSYKI